MKRIIVSYNSYSAREIASWYGINVASNLTSYDIGENLPRDCNSVFEAFEELIKEYSLTLKDVEFIPFYAYIHGDIAFSLNRDGQFSCPFDSGIAGYLWVEKKEFAKLQGYKRFTKKVKERFEEDCKSFIKMLNGNAYTINVYEDDEFIGEVSEEVVMEFEDKDLVLQKVMEEGLIKEGDIYKIEWCH